MKKSNKLKTVSAILREAKVGDTLKAGRLCWRVSTLDFDGCIVAVPSNKRTGFELWSTGIESVAVIPGLRLLHKVS
jgi:hypothetical protein